MVPGSRSQLRKGPCRWDQLHEGDKASSAQAAVVRRLAQEALWSHSRARVGSARGLLNELTKLGLWQQE